MKGRLAYGIAIALIGLNVAGCKRTVENVSEWEANGDTEKLVSALTDPQYEVRRAAAISLGKLKAINAVEALAICLNDENEGVQLSAVHAMVAIGSPATIPPLISVLNLDNENARIEAANALGNLKATDAVNPLAEMLDDPSESIQLAAIDALATIGTPDTLRLLIAALKLDRTQACVRAAKALGNLNSSDAVAPLGEALFDKKESLQLAACHSLAAIGDEAGCLPLVNKLADSSASQKVRTACIRALVEIGGGAAVQALIDSLADGDDSIREAAAMGLLEIGTPAIPALTAGLKNRNTAIRTAAINLLRKLNAVPSSGNDFVWYQLAAGSGENTPESLARLAATLLNGGQKAIPILLEAASSNILEFREPAVQALEQIGEPCLNEAMSRLEHTDSSPAKEWAESRAKWLGAPSKLLDLYASLSALNPDFEVEPETVEALQAGGRIANERLASDEFNISRAYIPYIVTLLGDETCAETARQRLEAVGAMAALPLIAAISSSHTAIAETAAAIMVDQSEERAYGPVIEAVRQRMYLGASLSRSALYSSLLKIDTPEAEALLLKIRPSPDRALMMFRAHYPGVATVGVQTIDPHPSKDAPIRFRICYQGNRNLGILEVIFKKDKQRNWLPAPGLPETLPKTH